MVSVGDGVPDGYKQTESWSKKGTEWLEDVAEFYHERASIEREAASKLASLAAKHYTKKAASSAAVSVGEHPAVTPGSLENGSLQAWMEMLNQTEAMATQRRQLADDLSTSVGDAVAATRKKFDDLNAYYKTFHHNLEDQRDNAYQAVKKAKSAYDDACATMESARSKNKKVEKATEEMYNAKTQYLLAINVANRIKDKYYHDDIPEMLDSWQVANEARTAQLNLLLKRACEAETSRLNSCISALKFAFGVVEKNSPEIDSRMFVEHNSTAFSDPTDFYFQPSPIWHDNDEFYIGSDAALRYMRAKLGSAEDEAAEAGADSQERVKAYEKARAAAQKSSDQPTQLAALLRAQATALEKLVAAESRRLSAEVEIDAIEAATASVDMSQIPETRTKTHRTLLGRKKEVVEVVDTSHSAHHRTSKLGLKSLLARATNAGTTGSGSAGKAHVLYAFEAGGPGELTVPAGSALPVVEGDDGSGWIRVRYDGKEGLVPASYVEIEGPKQAHAPPPPPSRGSKQPTMVALYNYDATDSSQLTIHAGETIVIVTPDSGTGWTTGRVNGQEGMFPTSYAR